MGAQKRLPSVLNSYEQLSLLKQPNPKAPTGLRNLCIISLMLKSGLRVSEVIGLTEDDIDWDSGKVHIKGSGAALERILWLEDPEIDLLKRWRIVKPVDSRRLFTTLDGSALKDRYIREMIKRLARKAGILKDVYPHLLRYTFAVDFMREIKDIHLLQEAMGHRDPAATQVYAKLLFDELKEPCFSEAVTKRSGMPVPDDEQKRFSVIEKHHPEALENSGNSLAKPIVVEPLVSGEGYNPSRTEERKENQSVVSNDSIKNKDFEPITEPEIEKKAQEPEPNITVVAETGESARIKIPAIKCSQCSFILRYQGDCPQCGTSFISILRHWGKNI